MHLQILQFISQISRTYMHLHALLYIAILLSNDKHFRSIAHLIICAKILFDYQCLQFRVDLEENSYRFREFWGLHYCDWIIFDFE